MFNLQKSFILKTLFDYFKFGQKNIKSISIFILMVLAFQNCSQVAEVSHDGKAYKLTNELIELNKIYKRSNTQDQELLKSDFITKAEERRAFLLELIKTNPAEVLRVAIPETQQKGMPEAVIDLLEQKLELEGELNVVYEDYADGKHMLRHFLKTPSGEKFELHLADLPADLQSHSQVQVNGLLLSSDSTQSRSINGAMALDSTESSIEFMDCCDSTASNSSTTPELTTSYGEKRALVILVNFQDKPEQPWTQEEVRHVFFDETSAYFMENSSGQTWLSGDVAGWYTLPISSTVCDEGAILTYAHEAAQAAGVDVSGYHRYVYVFPRNACPWAGRAQVGGGSPPAWLNGYMQLKLTSHELGHNFGLGHSKSLDCDAGTIEGYCFTRGYGDTLDTMGNYYSGHYNAFHKERLGWLGYNGTPDIQTVESSGTYTLSAYSANTSGPKALKVLKGIDPSTGLKTWYYIEYRQAQGFDSFIGDPASAYINGQNILNGVVVHLATEGNYDSSQLLDMTPDSDPAADFSDPALEVSKSFSDSDSGIMITTNWVDGTQANVDISLGAQPCVHADPTLLVTPSANGWVEAGTSVNYGITLTNNDNSSCSISTFSLSSAVPFGWTADFANTDLTLIPGESVSTTLTVTSSSTETDGYYSIGVVAANGSYSASTTVSYVVDNPTVTNSAPVANDDSASTSENTTVTINVLANDSDPDGDTLSVSSVSGVNGTATINANGSIAFTPTSGFTGTETFSYTISDGNGGEASANITVNVIKAADTTNPLVSITSPSANSIVSGLITIQASASDNDAIAKVEFKIDGSLLSSDLTSPYSASLDSTKFSNGSHKISAQATDVSGNKSLISEITVNIDNVAQPPTSDTTAPTVVITSPTDGGVVSSKSTITIMANASDDVAVSRVEFYVNGSLICSDSMATYSCSYGVPGGKNKSLVIQAKAFDSSGNSDSHQIQVSISNSTTDSGSGDGGGPGNNSGKGNKK